MKKFLSSTSENSFCKVPAPKVETLVIWAKYSLAVGAALLAGLLPVPANAQVSQERSELLSEQDRIAQQQLSGQNEGISKGLIEKTNQLLSLEPVNDLSLGSKIAEPIEGVTQPILIGDDFLEEYAVTALTPYLASPQIGPGQCRNSVFENYGCYAILAQGGVNSFNATANGSSSPSASALNAQEANTFYFPNGNPGGTWLEAQSVTLSGQPKSGFNEFAIGAAKVMSDWKSPVFFQAEFGFGSQANAVLESITFTSPYNNVLATLCDSRGFSDKTADVRTVARNCAFQIGINTPGIPQTTVSSIDIAYWPVNAGSSQSRIDRTYTGSSLDSFISDNFNRASNRTYVWDPPETAETAEPVPEPSSVLGVLTLGLFGIVSSTRRKRRDRHSKDR